MKLPDFDVIIIGAGVAGCSAARELSRYRLKIGVLEKTPDVCCGTSARNSGVIHAGFNNKPGSKMARFCVLGNAGFDAVAKELDIPFKRTGKLVVGFTDDDKKHLEAMKEQGEKNGVPDLQIVDKEFIQKTAPNVKGEFALWSGSTGICSPFEYTLAMAENAAKNGTGFYFENEVREIKRDGKEYTVISNAGTYSSRWIINCAGLGSDKISAMLGIDEYTIHPCKGEYFILDKKAGPLLPVPAYPVPNPKEGGLGIHLTPTIDGNILVGPSNEYLYDCDDHACEQDVMDMLIADGSRIFPHLKREYFIRNFSGIRPKLASKDEGGYRDFVIERRDGVPHAINLVGIESPGLTAAVPISKEIVRLMSEVEELLPNEDFNPVRHRIESFADKTPEEQARLISENPDYGEIVCRCETITKAEVLAAINNPLGVHTMTGVKYRCRAMMGRCQSGYCQTRIAELIMSETGCSREDIVYSKDNSWMFTGKVRG